MPFKVLEPTDTLMAMKMLIYGVQCPNGDVNIQDLGRACVVKVWSSFCKEVEIRTLAQMIRSLQSGNKNLGFDLFNLGGMRMGRRREVFK